MTSMLAVILGASACSGASAVPLPALPDVTSGEVRTVRALIDAGRRAAARTRWAALTGWSPAGGANAYGRADAAFSDATSSPEKFRVAFQLYDAIFSCGQTSELNPQAFDTGAAAALERALHAAGSGKLKEAAKLLRGAAQRDPSSIESRYFLGLVEVARGDPRAAQAAWKAAIDADGYTQSPDGWTLDRAQEAALQRYLAKRERGQ